MKSLGRTRRGAATLLAATLLGLVGVPAHSDTAEDEQLVSPSNIVLEFKDEGVVIDLPNLDEGGYSVTDLLGAESSPDPIASGEGAYIGETISTLDSKSFSHLTSSLLVEEPEEPTLVGLQIEVLDSDNTVTEQLRVRGRFSPADSSPLDVWSIQSPSEISFYWDDTAFSGDFSIQRDGVEVHKGTGSSATLDAPKKATEYVVQAPLIDEASSVLPDPDLSNLEPATDEDPDSVHHLQAAPREFDPPGILKEGEALPSVHDPEDSLVEESPISMARDTASVSGDLKDDLRNGAVSVAIIPILPWIEEADEDDAEQPDGTDGDVGILGHDNMYLRHTAFIYRNMVGCCRTWPAPRDQWYGGDSRGWSATSGAYRTRLQQRTDWSENQPRVYQFRGAGTTHRYEYTGTSWQWIDSRTANAREDMGITYDSSSMSIWYVRSFWEHEGRNPFQGTCAISYDWDVDTWRDGVITMTGSHDNMPSHEVYRYYHGSWGGVYGRYENGRDNDYSSEGLGALCTPAYTTADVSYP